ncbi:MAG: hypothetical protein JO142_19280, partial [Burkholderiales bacterium]|nr:hypothetical protein [Burkholderiales bacterium]
LPLVNGLRGAVLLSPGVFQIPAPINLPASGVVLRGSGSGANGTVLQGVGAGHLMIQVGNTNASVTAVGSTSTTITDAYLPSGSSSFHVADTSKVQVGEPVWVRRRATSAWIHFMGMDTLVRSGNPQTWIDANNDNEIWRRTITAVNGNQVSLDQPLTDSFDSTYIATNGGTVEQYTTSGIVSQIGVEHLAMEGMPRGSGFDYGVINIDGASDAWMNDVLAHNFTSGVVVARNGSRITIESVQLSHDNNNVTCPGAKQFEFSIDGTQVLVDRSSSTGSMQAFYYATQGQTTGPNVLLNFTGRAQACAAIEPHQRWASGLLVDGANISGEIALGDRGTDGSGHGWSMGWGVVWNSSADALAVQSPPGATNWVIGSSGTVNKVIADGENVPSNIQLGTYDSQNIPVAPQSLYLAQLCQRLGPQALRNIGY